MSEGAVAIVTFTRARGMPGREPVSWKVFRESGTLTQVQLASRVRNLHVGYWSPGALADHANLLAYAEVKWFFDFEAAKAFCRGYGPFPGGQLQP